jgi:hypothetical protein
VDADDRGIGESVGETVEDGVLSFSVGGRGGEGGREGQEYVVVCACGTLRIHSAWGRREGINERRLRRSKQREASGKTTEGSTDK